MACDPPPSSSVHGILQARILEWVSISFSRVSSQPKDRTWVSRIAGEFFTVWATRNTQILSYNRVNIPCMPPVLTALSIKKPWDSYGRSQLFLQSECIFHWLFKQLKGKRRTWISRPWRGRGRVPGVLNQLSAEWLLVQEGLVICGGSHEPHVWMEVSLLWFKSLFSQSPWPSLTCVWVGDWLCLGLASGFLGFILLSAFQDWQLWWVLTTRTRVVTSRTSNHPTI